MNHMTIGEKCMMEGNRDETIRILEARIRDMDENARSVQTMKKALEKLLSLLHEADAAKNYMDFVQEDTIMELTKFLPLEKHHLKGEQKNEYFKGNGRKRKLCQNHAFATLHGDRIPVRRG